MKKILTIIATAALFSTMATAAHAAPIEILGSVGSSCVLTVTDGSLGAATGPATQIDSSANGGFPAQAKVVCNGPSTLAVGVGAGSVANGGGVSAYFRAGGSTGEYATIAPVGDATNSSITTTGVTQPNGDTALIDGRIERGGLLLLAADDYKVVANVTLTAN